MPVCHFQYFFGSLYTLWSEVMLKIPTLLFAADSNETLIGCMKIMEIVFFGLSTKLENKTKKVSIFLGYFA